MLKSQLFKKISLIIILSTIASCSNTKGWVYKVNSRDIDVKNSSRNETIVVLPFLDKRSNENKNNYMLYLIPLMPFGFQDLSSPETVQIHANSGLWINFNPKEDFAKALVEELSSSGVFKEAFFSNSIGDSEYYIKGEIISTNYNAKLFSYGLSAYGPFLWYIGLPATSVSNDLEVKLSLFNSKTRKEIFTRNYAATHYEKIGWIYGLPSDFYYSEMLAELYKKFFEDLSKELLTKK